MKAISYLLLFTALNVSAIIIPDGRRITWQGNVGIPGGITNRTTIFTNMTLIDNTGSADVTAAIQSALDTCPAGQVVKLPTGTFKTSARLIMKNSYSLRGDGPTKTIINNLGSESIVAFGTASTGNMPYYRYGSGLNVANITTSDINKGDTSFVVSSTTGISTGKLISWDELNDYTICTNWGNDGGGSFFDGASRDGTGGRIPAQTVYVTGLAGSTVSFDPPSVWYFSNSLTPQSVAFTPTVTYAGVEGLKVQGNNFGLTANFTFIACAYCWMTNVESSYPDGDHIVFDSSVRCEVRHCYLHDGWLHTSGTTDDCVRNEGHSTGMLIIDNIFRRNHLSYMPLCSTVGNVIAYNLFTNNFDHDSLTSVPNDVEDHGSNPMMELYEGNIIGTVNQDGVHGTAYANTLLRNLISGRGQYCGPVSGQSAEDNNYTNQFAAARCINLSGYGNTRNWNVVGNFLGIAGMGNYPQFNPIFKSVSPTFREYDHAGYVWTLGYVQGNDDGTDARGNTTPSTTLLDHANWDIVNGAQTFDGTISDHAVPNSYFLTGKPAFFGNLTWPPFDPTSSSTAANLIPALYRFLNGVDPPTDPNITVQPVSQTVSFPTAATFTVTATGNSALSYQWNWFGTNVTGATSSSWTTPASLLSYNGSLVFVTVTDTAGSIQSSTVSFFVNGFPAPGEIIGTGVKVGAGVNL